MSNEIKNSESREQALERILAEAASGKYRSRTKPASEKKPEENKTRYVPMTEAEKAEAAKERAARKAAVAEAEKAEAEKARTAEKIAEIKRRKQLAQQEQATAERQAQTQIMQRELSAGNKAHFYEDEDSDYEPFEQEYEQSPEDDENMYQELYSEKKKGIRLPGALCDILDIAECVISAAFVIILIFTYLIHIASVQGTSMVPTLEENDRLLVSALGYTPETGDVVVIDNQSAYTYSEDGNLVQNNGLEKSIVKRIIAVGGQTIDFDFEEGIVYVDGEALDEPYISEATTRDEGAFEYPLEIPEGYVFVLGDNRNISKDSRHPEVGLIPEDEIVGKVLLRVYPFSDFGRID